MKKIKKIINSLKDIKTKYILIILFILFYFIFIEKVNVNEKNISPKKLDPFYAFSRRLNSSPLILCKSEDSEHICYKNDLSYFFEKDGIICKMKNFIINPLFWKQDGYIYKGPVNIKTRGCPLISKGFFNMKCNIKNKIQHYNSIYFSYLNSWNYNLDNNIIIKEELFPGKTLFLISRNQDSPNLFHGGCEFINAYSLMNLLGLKPPNIQILFLESMKFNNDPYYDLYKYVISGGNEPIHISQLKKTYFVSNAFHLPINWDSPCFTKCEIPKFTNRTLTYRKLYEDVLKYMKIPNFVDSFNYNKEIFYYSNLYLNTSKLNYTKFLTIQWRKIWPKERIGQFRILGNGPEIVDILVKILPKNILIRLVDTASLPISKQISIMQKTDYFLGIHGAGLILSIFLPPHSIVHEIKNKDEMNNLQILSILSGHRCYSDIIETNIKNINNSEYLFFNPYDIAKKVLKHMKQNKF